MTNFDYLISKIVVYKLRQMFGADQVTYDDATGNISVSGIDFEIHETSGLTALNALVVDQTLGYSREIHEDSEAKFASAIADYIFDTASEYLDEGQHQSIEESQTITAAQTVGTVFYQVTEGNVKEVFHGDKGNMWTAATFASQTDRTFLLLARWSILRKHLRNMIWKLLRLTFRNLHLISS